MTNFKLRLPLHEKSKLCVFEVGTALPWLLGVATVSCPHTRKRSCEENNNETLFFSVQECRNVLGQIAAGCCDMQRPWAQTVVINDRLRCVIWIPGLKASARPRRARFPNSLCGGNARWFTVLDVSFVSRESVVATAIVLNDVRIKERLELLREMAGIERNTEETVGGGGRTSRRIINRQWATRKLPTLNTQDKRDGFFHRKKLSLSRCLYWGYKFIVPVFFFFFINLGLIKIPCVCKNVVNLAFFFLFEIFNSSLNLRSKITIAGLFQ